ncbi:MAG: carboxypeptidase-like regulatory domain-containing protein, partial [Acidobacteriota bacterium]
MYGQEREGQSCRFDFSFELKTEEDALDGVLRLRPTDKDEWTSTDIANHSATVRLEVGRSWILESSIHGYWGPTQVLNVAEDCVERAHVLPLWPTGRISGQLTVDQRRSDLPTVFTAKLRSSERPIRSGLRAIGRVDCAVDRQKATWSCELPAGTMDLVFSSTDLAPIYRRQVQVKRSEDLRVPNIDFRTGASVAGYVEVEDGEISSKSRARIRPIELGSTVRNRKEGEESAVVDEQGFFQVAGLPSGSYELEIAQPGFAPQKVFPLELFEGQETFLKESIVLRRPLDIEVQISPSLDWLESPWLVTLMRASSQSAQFEDEPVFSGPAEPSGFLTVPDQPPGRYSLTVQDSEGNAFYTELIVTIDTAADAQIGVDIDLVVVEGEVSLGDRPVVGELFFGGVHGARSVRLPIDSEGFFYGVLPEEGLWEVDIRAQTPDLVTTLETEVEVGPSGRAILDIELPDTQVFGRVVGADGKPIEGARVSLSTEVGSISTESGVDGAFELLAVPDKLAWISAKHSTFNGRQTSESVAVSIVEGQPTGPLLLRLVKNREIVGSVMGSFGPVAGARIQLRPSGSSLPINVKTRTDPSGSFSAEVPERSRRLTAVVSAPGHALTSLEFDIPENAAEPVVLEVPARGGTLEVRTARKDGWRLDVLQGGRPLSFQTLYEWTMAHGGELGLDDQDTTVMSIPQLAPENYRICMRPSRPVGESAVTDQPTEILERMRN